MAGSEPSEQKVQKHHEIRNAMKSILPRSLASLVFRDICRCCQESQIATAHRSRVPAFPGNKTSEVSQLTIHVTTLKSLLQKVLVLKQPVRNHLCCCFSGPGETRSAFSFECSGWAQNLWTPVINDPLQVLEAATQ